MSEITVILKDDDKTYRQKFLCYEQYVINPQGSFIQECIKAACENFKGTPDSIQIKIHMEV